MQDIRDAIFLCDKAGTEHMNQDEVRRAREIIGTLKKVIDDAIASTKEEVQL